MCMKTKKIEFCTLIFTFRLEIWYNWCPYRFQWRSHTFAMNALLCAAVYAKKGVAAILENSTTLYHSYVQVSEYDSTL